MSVRVFSDAAAAEAEMYREPIVPTIHPSINPIIQPSTHPFERKKFVNSLKLQIANKQKKSIASGPFCLF
jgi:hypothetical protein